MKLNFCFIKKDNGRYYWKDQLDNEMHFAGNPKFIVQALVKKFGSVKGEQVFNDFMEGLASIKEIEHPTSWIHGPASFVLYLKKSSYANKKGLTATEEEVHNGEEEHSEDGEDVVT